MIMANIAALNKKVIFAVNYNKTLQQYDIPMAWQYEGKTMADRIETPTIVPEELFNRVFGSYQLVGVAIKQWDKEAK